MITPEGRLLTMFVGWITALYGVHRRDWPGTFITMAGLALADGAMIIGEGERP
jgi:hypothetical protein